MTTPCHDIQQRLIQDQTLDSVQQRHLKGCADCRSFADVLNCLPDVEGDSSPPSHLDLAILDAAHAKAKEAKPRLLVMKPLILAAAAMAVLACVVWTLHEPETPGQDTPIALVNEPGSDHLQPANPLPHHDLDMHNDPVMNLDPVLAWDYDVVDQRLFELEAEVFMMDDIASPSKTIDQVL